MYARVVRRFWPLVSLGIVLAVLLGLLAVFRVGSHRVTFRKQETWKSAETLLLTQKGFPWGRSVYPYVLDKKTGQLIPSSFFANPTRFTDLAVFYAEVAESGTIRSFAFPRGLPAGETYSAAPVVNSVGGQLVGAQPITQIVPLIEIDGYAATPAGARSIAARVSRALRTYVQRSQRGASIPRKQRIVVQVLSAAQKPTLARKRPLTLAIAVFVGVVVVTLLLAFLLENLRPRPARDEEPLGWPLSDDARDRYGSPNGSTNGNGAAAAPARVPLALAPPLALGPRLRDARLRRGLDLRAVESRIDVRTKTLRALESGRFDLLPDHEAARAALRAYAEHLELDSAGCLGDLDAVVDGSRNGREP